MLTLYLQLVAIGGEASSSKSKGAATKSGCKSKDDTKVDGKLKDNTSKSGAKSKDNSQKKNISTCVPACGAAESVVWSLCKFFRIIFFFCSAFQQVENFLSRVEQSPSKSMQTALSPSMKALVADELLRHPDVDVKVAVASCISEITRITAPDAPYDDDQMKDVFRLIVSSFENLSDKSSRSYSKRTLILKTVAKVRSCVVMLDLECDGLIVEMFHHFLKAIRDYHPENVFSSMVTIMSLVLEESEDISFELISPILASLKKDNQEVLPIARKLGERVFENCATKVKPYLIQAKESLGHSFDDYSKVIASICDGTTDVGHNNDGTVRHNDDDACGEQLVCSLTFST
ncbi:sister chromatid cohesion protein PDS5-like [Camellia sinensis]|uniref:sister chromatid cohesion protein PDS5-like n=1 Tax=Camellia sinensis TaxID=4442 RepID=UPI0010363198|nr:sister chromatid cohesion protein PDS5-like [Camellia sinensis]